MKIIRKIPRLSRVAVLLFPVLVSSIIAPILWGLSSEVRAQSGMGKMAAMSREEQIAHHEKMIIMHTKMVACLKSQKSVEDCHKDMMTDCEAIHGGTCPMPMMGHHGDMHTPEAGMNHRDPMNESLPKK